MGSEFGLSQLILVFGTGVLASLSPCVYPILPITLGFLGQQVGRPAGERARSKILLYALGQTLAFVGLGIFVVFFGQTLGFSSQSRVVNLWLGAILLGAGAFSFAGRLPRFFSGWNNASSRLFNHQTGGKWGAFLMGVGSALVASPCTSPILGGVLALIATDGTVGKGIALMFVYSIGFSLLFVILGLGASRFSRRPRSGRWLAVFHLASSLLLVAGGGYYLARGFNLIG